MKQFGIITYLVYKFFYLLKFLPPQVFIEERIKSQIRIADFSPEDKQKEVEKRVFRTEGIILSYLAIYTVAIVFNQHIYAGSFLKWTTIILILLRLIDIIQVNVNVAVFDSIRAGNGTKADNKLHSFSKSNCSCFLWLY